jgi:AcrR family transcriptional regulator
LVRSKTPHLNERILEAAARLFASRRFHEVRMDDIAAEAGVSKGTLYRYFKDKEELYLALLELAGRQLIGRLQEAVPPGGETRNRLIILVQTLLEYFDRNPHLHDLIQRAEVLRRPGSPFPWQRFREENFRLVRQILEEGQRRGELAAAADLELATLMFLGGLRSVGRFGPQPHPPQLAERIVEQFLHGLARR